MSNNLSGRSGSHHNPHNKCILFKEKLYIIIYIYILGVEVIYYYILYTDYNIYLY